jgi:hypothetical protein
VSAASRWNARQKGKSALSAGGKKRKCIRGKKEDMNRKDELKRRIELKRQLIKLTEIEIEALESELTKKAATLATEKTERHQSCRL